MVHSLDSMAKIGGAPGWRCWGYDIGPNKVQRSVDPSLAADLVSPKGQLSYPGWLHLDYLSRPSIAHPPGEEVH